MKMPATPSCPTSGSAISTASTAKRRRRERRCRHRSSAEKKSTKVAILAYGTTHHAVVEARDFLRDAGVEVNYLRVRALPLPPEVAAFIKRHDRVYVVEQNRDGQLYGILRTELPTYLIGRLQSIRHYNGVPIDAHAIIDPLLEEQREPAVVAE